MRVYLAGPMSGIKDHNFPAFHAAAKFLRGLGLDVLNPAEINIVGTAWVDCMRADIHVLVTCDCIALLPGWQKSKGAALEHHIAKSLGFLIIHIDGVA